VSRAEPIPGARTFGKGYGDDEKQVDPDGRHCCGVRDRMAMD
jgi:hypothetical protein